MIRIFRVSVPVSVLALLTSEAALFFCSYILACYLVLDLDADTYLNEQYGIARIAAIAFAFICGAYLSDLYAQIRVRSNVVLVSRVMLILATAVIWEALLGFVNLEWALPTSVVLAGTILSIIVLSAWRVIYSRAVMSSIGSQTVLFMGSSPIIFKIQNQLQDRPELGLKVIGYVADGPILTSDLPFVGQPDNISSIVHQMKPNRLVIGMAERRARLPVYQLLDLRFAGFRIEEAVTLYEEAFGRVCIDEISPSQLIFTKLLAPRARSVLIQSLYANIVAITGLVLTAPLLLIAAVLIKLTSPGPVFYRQTRVGLNGKVFSLYKLRSMRQDAESGTGAVWATANDPRVTPIGRFLRKSRLDELPQLLNVLKGEMSIVGPRPERPEFVTQLTQDIAYYRQRHFVKPGITGWAQINHKYGDSIEHTKAKLEYDLYYITNFSLSLDAYIMFHTLKTMLLSRGAQ